MHYCSQCGTQNKADTKFCSNCGARLAPVSGLVCPMCSTPNPVETVFCNNCGARLVPMIAGADRAEAAPPIKGLSLPAKSAPVEPAPREPESQEWLADLRPAASEPAPTESTEDLPDWLRDAAPAAPARAIETPATDEPTWLRDLRQKADDVPVAPITEPESDSSWVNALPEKISDAPEPPAKTESTPNWLDDLRRSAASEKPRESVPELETDEPSWVTRLRDAAPTGSAPPDNKTAESSDARENNFTPRAASEKEDLPNWLQDLESQQAAPIVPSAEPEFFKPIEPATPRAFAALPAEETPVSEVPDWLRMAMPAEPAPITPAAAEEIPTWVARLKPAELAPNVSAEPAETSGPLAGLPGILPLAAAIALPHVSSIRAARANGASGAQMFEAILAAPAPSETTAPSKSRRALTMRPLIYFLLALAVIVPFFLPASLATSGLRISGTPAADFYDALQALPANSNVLLSFDYDPSLAGEMDLLANAVTRQLMQRRVKVIAVSVLPTGAPIAQRILQSTATANNYRYGTDYVNAGYIAGQEAGLAQFAANGLPESARDFVQSQSLRQLPITAKLTSPRDFAMLIELAGSDDALKMWMEQVQPRANVRIAAATSAAAEPKARAYKDAKQLAALVSGLLGAAQYEVLSNQPGQAVLRVNAQSAAQVVLVLVVVLGNIAFLISLVRRK